MRLCFARNSSNGSSFSDYFSFFYSVIIGPPAVAGAILEIQESFQQRCKKALFPYNCL